MHFLVTLALTIATTGLVSRLLFQVLSGWDSDLKPGAIHVWSFVLSGLLFVLWCSVAGAPLAWFSVHKVFLPQAAWFIYDILRSTGRRTSEDDVLHAQDGWNGTD